MTKNISNKLKTLLTLGVVTVATASSILPVSALTRNNYTNIKVKSNLYLYINGVIYKLPSNPSSPIKPEFKPNFGNNNNNNNNNNNINKPVNKPNNDNNNNSDTNKPVNKPNNDNNNNSNTNKPVNKPNNDNNDNNTTNKPVDKPNNNDINKPVNKPSDDNNNNNNTAGNFSSYQKQVLDLVNAERTKRGLKALTLDTKLSNVATMKSQDMIDKNYFDHNSPTYGSPFDMMKKFGVNYRSAGENIAEGQTSPQEVMNAWMNSEGHRKNILNPDFTTLGVGVAKTSSGRLYWTQMFIG